MTGKSYKAKQKYEVHGDNGGTTVMVRKAAIVAAAVALLISAVLAADVKVDLSKETVGKPPTTFEPMATCSAGRKRPTATLA